MHKWLKTVAICTALLGFSSQAFAVPATNNINLGASAQVMGTRVDSFMGTVKGKLDQQVGNLPNGYARLSPDGFVTVPVMSNSFLYAAATMESGDQPAIPLEMLYNGWKGDGPSHVEGPRFTVGPGSSAMADQMMMVGGHRLYDSVFSKFYGLPYGVGDQGGCVHSSVMTYAPGTGANCGAGGWDAVTEYELATNNPPWYMTGAEMPDENGIPHGVTFTANSAIVRPGLPVSYKDYMHHGAHVLTNIVSGPTIYSGASMDGVQAHMNQDQRFYGNTLDTWTDGSDANGSYTILNMTGQWQPISGDSVEDGHIPAVGATNKGGTDALDQVQYGEFKYPVLVVGTYLKHFTRNTSCEVIVKPGMDGEAVKRFGGSRKCDEELDNWYHGPDYGATMHGLTIGAGFDNRVSQDSYALALAGAWPEGARIWLGSDGYDIDGDAFVTGSRMGAPAVTGNRKMMLQVFQEPTANIGYLEQMQLWSQTDSISEQNNGNTHGPAANGQDISYWFGPRQSGTKYNADGNFESGIAFNPGWAKNGVALCGINATKFDMTSAGTACLTVDEWGNTSTSGTMTANAGLTVKGAIDMDGGNFSSNVTINAGKSITFNSADGKQSGYTYMDADSFQHWSNGVYAPNFWATANVNMLSGSSAVFYPAGTTSNTHPFIFADINTLVGTVPVLRVANNANSFQVLAASAFMGSLATPASSSAVCAAGQFQDDANYHYVCTATNHWKRVALSDF